MMSRTHKKLFKRKMPALLLGVSLLLTGCASSPDAAENFADGDYVTVTAPSSGTLTSGSNSASFTNSLTSAKLTAKGQSIGGKITVKTPPAAGTYNGTLRFTISLYSSAK